MTKWRERFLPRPHAVLGAVRRPEILVRICCALPCYHTSHSITRSGGEHRSRPIKKATLPARALSRRRISRLRIRRIGKITGRSSRRGKPIFRYESNKAEQAVQSFLSSWEKLQRHGGESVATKPTNSDTKGRDPLDGRRRTGRREDACRRVISAGTRSTPFKAREGKRRKVTSTTIREAILSKRGLCLRPLKAKSAFHRHDAREQLDRPLVGDATN